MRAASMHYQLSAGGLRDRELEKMGETREQPGSGPDRPRCPQAAAWSWFAARASTSPGTSTATSVSWGKMPGFGGKSRVWGEIPGFWGEFQCFRVSEKLQEVSRSSRVLDAPPNPLN